MIKQAKDIKPGDMYNGRMVTSVYVGSYLTNLKFADGKGLQRMNDEQMLVKESLLDELTTAFGEGAK